MGDRLGRRIETDADIAGLLGAVKSVAVLGIKTEAQADQPAYYVPAYAKRAGLAVIPVPVYYPEAKTILGEPVYRSVSSIERDVDLVNVFRRPSDVDQHVDDILSKRPRAVWLQSGIRNEAAAERFIREGIDVVQDRCLMVELRRLGRLPRPPSVERFSGRRRPAVGATLARYERSCRRRVGSGWPTSA